ncbi:hypothetical protein M9H77_10993 [Catharanthus roseus]|uniref:Uncharacterized protein n=1 Tax=Catharanthus roseus TaxID=4058 RepID=A0ACC0BDD3_CATRO|nr:hypothetical protein M9H77_10993 [Catharanthus roseus]
MNMDATHPVRVVLFWDSEHSRDAYGPYFTGAAKKIWTFTRIVTHDELVRKILKHRGMDPNFWRVRMTMKVSSFYEEYQMFNFTLYSVNSDDEIRYLWIIRLNISEEGIHEDDDDNDNADKEYDVSSESDDDNNPDDEEVDISTHLWQMARIYITCSHAFSVCRDNGTRPDAYVPDIYSRET